MGWERKRGKLHEFNRLLRGADDTTFYVKVGNLEHLPQINYVITLDADTVLPADAARRLVGTLAHPLNRAQFDGSGCKVIDGYTVLQPRADVQPRSSNHSLFTRVFAGDVGLDLYSTAVSDVYQDLFCEGIYVGKGIYNVDAFERSLEGRIPENTLLSHDLLEGLYGRAALVTDIVLYEDYPPNYLVYIRRSHRWIRGDWQLLPWLLSLVSRSDGGDDGDRLSLIDRWKIADNMRRSLFAPALFLFFIAGWLLFPGSPLVWTLAGLAMPAVALMTSTAMAIGRGITGLPEGASWRDLRRPVVDSAIRWLLQIAFLPYEALLAADAIISTLWRLFVSRRLLLQWTTAAHTVRLIGQELSVETSIRQMLPSMLPVLAVSLILIVRFVTAVLAGNVDAAVAGTLPAAPVILAWLLSSWIAHWISRRDHVAPAELSLADRRRLYNLARRTWLFFEQYVGPEDNWLPPDHFQESPRGVVAHRTSPTNTGLYLLSAVAAHDLGYISILNLALRLRSTFETLEKLDRYRGHFLNWINTSTLHPLTPRYVSTVDSGNLAACLLVVRQVCHSIQEEPIWRQQRWQGLADMIALVREMGVTLGEIIGSREAAADALAAVQNQLAQMQGQLRSVGEDSTLWGSLVLYLTEEAQPVLEQRLLQLANTLGGSGRARVNVAENPHSATPSVDAPQPQWMEALDAATLHNWRIYVERLRQNIQRLQRETELLFPWLLTIQQAPALLADPETPAPVREAWEKLRETLTQAPTLGELSNHCQTAEQQLQQLEAAVVGEQEGIINYQLSVDNYQLDAVREWFAKLRSNLTSARAMAEGLIDSYILLGRQAGEYVAAMDFTFLYNDQRQVFHIGYNVESGQLDNNFYDLLASEARIASIVAIAKRDVPIKHWLHLARPLTRLDDGMTLLSWSGTMFEYLMPPLLMRSYRGTLLEQSSRVAVEQQILYARQNGVPWGISESGFYTFDNAQNYQYRAFGVPDLGYKRGLGEDLVVTPYASILAVHIRPDAVINNLDALLQWGLLGPYGLYEAIDFTPSRLELGQDAAIVRSYMSHHQGMIMLALANYLQHDRMVQRFHADPSIQSMELLLQEQVPVAAPMETAHAENEALLARPDKPAITADPWPVPTGTPMPLVHYLSNGRFSSLITNAGGGYLSGDQDGATIAYTRWRPDTTLDDWGLWLYIQDRDNGALWSAAAQPVATALQQQEVYLYPHMVHFRRRDHDVTVEMQITVTPNDNVEIRRIYLTNESERTRRLRLTSYSEVVLTDLGTDTRHPAFGKLFVESEYIPDVNLLMFRRRPRSEEEAPRYLGHMLVLADGERELTRTYETDRNRFLGRNRTARRPLALAVETRQALDRWLSTDRWLSATTGATLDSIMAVGQEMRLRPHDSAQLALVTIAAGSRAEMVRLAREYQRWPQITGAFDLARTQAEQELRQLNFPVAELDQTQRLLSLLVYTHPALRAELATLAANEKGQSTLWAYGISGDYPILLLRISDESQGDLLYFLLRAHRYWRRRGLKIDLVILNDQETSYGQPVQGFIYRTIQRTDSAQWLNRRGGLFVLYRDQIGREDTTLLETAARVILNGTAGSVEEQLATLFAYPATLPGFLPLLSPAEAEETMPPLERPADLHFDNGYGGFSADGKEYIIYLEPGHTTAQPSPTPAPWINVVANPEFGFLVSETGGGYTWAGNSSENRLTPWRNDPVMDTPAEVFYLRDEETGEIWTPTPQPTPADSPYLVRHGAGYTTFEHHSHRLKQQLRLFAPADGPVKIAHLRLENTSRRPRRITVTFYAEWVLGTDRSTTQPYIIPYYNPESHAILARNPYNMEFGEAVAFMATSKAPHGLTADRAEFLGRLGTLQRPAALERIGLSDRVHAGLDSCAAMMMHIDLPPGGSEEVHFLLGQDRNEGTALATIERFRDPTQVAEAWEGIQRLWDEVLGAVTVRTPDPAMDLLLNRWLLYQALSCRIWGRSALYQSGGAYGYRDQLQDVMSLLHTRPDLAREHLLRAARHQFATGDVLHWWHPPSGRGVRTRISDDLAWLPYVTAHYVRTTADVTVLDEEIPYLTGKPLEKDEEERYGHYSATEERYCLYDHCCRALDRAATGGRHGLPLMGAGDWNDGMNRVGIEGKGESVWLGWFLHGTLNDFAELCEQRGDVERAAAFRQKAEAYRQAIEQHAWDGEWYRRAYYDDGRPLGSRLNSECKIDAIAQSWGVLTGAADPRRARLAMEAVKRLLVDEKDRLLLLFTPPFDKTPQDPGYIKGYLPGIRENGGQYTHAALWTIWALAELGQGDEAEALYQLINPISRSDTPEKADIYKVEPYVISADVYGVEPHEGRGGWTWYTGSSGWMYRLGLEGILGLERAGPVLRVNPRIPRSWPEYRMAYRYGRSVYEIVVKNPDRVNEGVERIVLDGEVLAENEILLRDDGGRYRVEVVMGLEVKAAKSSRSSSRLPPATSPVL
jgi:cyclic beta-1,2-glucan synthetase